jgi:hypothetical protein
MMIMMLAIITTIIKNSILYLFICLSNDPRASYKINTAKDGNKEAHTHTNNDKIQNKTNYVI